MEQYQYSGQAYNATPPPDPKKSRNMLIIVIVALILLCCCCLFIGAASTYLWNYGDQLLGDMTRQLVYLRV
jgi:hypothetical protein